MNCGISKSKAMEVMKSSLFILFYWTVAGCLPLRYSDRSLHVRSIPAIKDVSSNIYEVLMRPYTFGMRPVMAAAEMNHVTEDVKGALFFNQRFPPIGPVLVTGNLTGLTPGKHAIFVHEWGDLRNGCDAAGPLFNPYKDKLGARAGELGNFVAGEDGTAQVLLREDLISLTGSRGIVGRAVSLEDHSAAVACGVVGYTPPLDSYN